MFVGNIIIQIILFKLGICDCNVASIHARQNVKIPRELAENVQVEKICNIVFMLKSCAPPKKLFMSKGICNT